MVTDDLHIRAEGQAQDVTRRYAKSYNGKTRKLRVSCTKGGPEWWNRVLKVFQRGWDLVCILINIPDLVPLTNSNRIETSLNWQNWCREKFQSLSPTTSKT